ncbi:MAG: hypothetical protein ACFFCW_14185 [Candidatus Hodarchaeota archaeon]
MQRRAKRVILFWATLVTVIALFAFAAWLYYPTELNMEKPQDFYAVSREASLSELIQMADKNSSVTLYLPSALPPGFQLTAIYLSEGADGYFIAMVVYSATGNKDYKTAELVIQIAPSLLSPTYEQLQTWVKDPKAKEIGARALEINGWPVRVDERASTGGDEEHVAKYGEYQLLVEVWIEGINYTISPMTLTPDEAIQLVRSMRPIS